MNSGYNVMIGLDDIRWEEQDAVPWVSYSGENITVDLCAPSEGAQCDTPSPTDSPSYEPTWEPTFEPTFEPTLEPTLDPTLAPSAPYCYVIYIYRIFAYS